MTDTISSFPSARKWAIPVTLAASVSIVLISYLTHKTAEFDIVPTSPLIIPAETAQPLDIISRTAYDSQPFMVAVGDRELPLPYEMISGKDIVERQIQFRCNGGLQTMHFRGSSIRKSLEEVVSREKSGTYTAYEITAADGLTLTVPADAEVILSASSKNDTGKHTDTPYDVVAISGKEAFVLGKAASVRPVQSTAYGLSSGNAELFNHVYDLNTLISSPAGKNLEGRRIPLQDLTTASALLIAGDGYKQVIRKEFLGEVYLVRHGQGYDVDAPGLGKTFQIRDVQQVGLQEALGKENL